MALNTNTDSINVVSIIRTVISSTGSIVALNTYLSSSESQIGVITAPSTASYTGFELLSPPWSASLPGNALGVHSIGGDLNIYINSLPITRNEVSFVSQSGNTIQIGFNTAQLGYTINGSPSTIGGADEVILVGKYKKI